ncbi:hypothetical protein [uncultured Tateyamaria sp.]|uniref:hypothetical protein n=1 Tax=uncultured Tateyamaria sp. TaxID=455651 RepID=UPI00261C501E|nr:hypothetical protein [uncultured Tateyamaria sp.]
MPSKPDHRLTIRFTPEEYAQLQAKAGDQALSAFVRTAALADAATKRAKPTRRPKTDQRVLAAILARLSVHPLVQSFKDAEQHIDKDTTDAATSKTLSDCAELLEDVRAMLMQALGKAP